MTSYAAEILGMSTGLALVGLLVVVPLVCLGIVLLSRHVSIRREESLHRDFHEQRLDIERRERRLTERESRLDAEAAALAEREQARRNLILPLPTDQTITVAKPRPQPAPPPKPPSRWERVKRWFRGH